MREILELCVELDERAEKLYSTLASVAPDETLRHTFRELGKDEAEQTGWWCGLLEAWEQGLLPDVVNDTELLMKRFSELRDELAAIDLSRLGELSVDGMLALAARLEFSMIDPVFGELIDLTEPGRAEHRQTAYRLHLQRLIDAISAYYEPGSLAALLAGTLSRAWRDNVRLAVFATHDMLTGLYNRRALHSHLPQWTAWSARYGHPLAVLLIDVDGFKQVNDVHGHAAGDRALKAVAAAIRSATRASDLVIRYGGDEFAVIAPETDTDEYCELCQRISDTVREVAIDVDGGPVPLTVSIGGVVAKDPPGSPQRRIESLLAAADQSLYAAKTSGRNCVGTPAIA